MYRESASNGLKKNRLIVLGLFLWVFCMPLQAKANSGEFVLKFAYPKQEPYNYIAEVFEKSGDFKNIVEGINHAFKVPRDVLVQFQMGDGPFYDPTKSKIEMSYEFINYLSELYVKEYPHSKEEEVITFALRSTVFLFYHELAHAFIDIYSLPIVSNEETAADNLAVILALEYTKGGYDIVMDSAELFDIMDSSDAHYKDTDLWDEHALNSQRFYNVVCMAYGKYPKRVVRELTSVKSDALLRFIDEKGKYCEEEYTRQASAWHKLLAPYFR